MKTFTRYAAFAAFFYLMWSSELSLALVMVSVSTLILTIPIFWVMPGPNSEVMAKAFVYSVFMAAVFAIQMTFGILLNLESFLS